MSCVGLQFLSDGCVDSAVNPAVPEEFALGKLFTTVSVPLFESLISSWFNLALSDKSRNSLISLRFSNLMTHSFFFFSKLFPYNVLNVCGVCCVSLLLLISDSVS